MPESPRMQPIGDVAVRIALGNEISPQVHQRVRACCSAVEESAIAGVTECAPAYTSLTVFYRAHEIHYTELVRRLTEILATASQDKTPAASVITLPVLYGGEHGPDLPFVAEHAKLPADEVIALHAQPRYLIYMIGFVPGFPYLGGLNAKIAAPRLATPRRAVAPGSVGIGGDQTGVYPLETPGGWRIIGRTPVKLFDSNREPPILLRSGDYLKFHPVDAAEFQRIERDIAAGAYRIERKAQN